jgi:hypothetical protein
MESKDDKERILQKDMKNRNKKDDRYRDKLSRDRDPKISTKSFRDRDDRVKERDIKQNKKPEDKKFYNKKDDRESQLKEDRIYDKEEVRECKIEEKRGKSYEKMRQDKKRLAETQKKQNIDSSLKEPDENQSIIDDSEDRDDEETCMLNLIEKDDIEYKNKYKSRMTMDGMKNDEETTRNYESSEISRVSKTEISPNTEEINACNNMGIIGKKLEGNYYIFKNIYFINIRKLIKYYIKYIYYI